MSRVTVLLLATFVFILTSTSSAQNIGLCSDINPSCPVWSSLGYCSSNRGIREMWCRESCGNCDTPTDDGIQHECKDKNPYCENWAVNHQCIENPSFMSLNCQKACGLCTDEQTDGQVEDVLLTKSRAKEWGKWLSAAANGIYSIGSLISYSNVALMEAITDQRVLPNRLQVHMSLLAYSSRVHRTLLNGTPEKIRSRAQHLRNLIDESDRIVGSRRVDQVKRYLPTLIGAMTKTRIEVEDLARKWTLVQKEGLLGADYSSSLNEYWNTWIQFPQNLEIVLTLTILPSLEELEQKLQIVLHYNRVAKTLSQLMLKSAQMTVTLRHVTTAWIDFSDQHLLLTMSSLEGLITTQQLPSSNESPVSAAERLAINQMKKLALELRQVAAQQQQSGMTNNTTNVVIHRPEHKNVSTPRTTSLERSNSLENDQGEDYTAGGAFEDYSFYDENQSYSQNSSAPSRADEDVLYEDLSTAAQIVGPPLMDDYLIFD